jgi:hypothetical protein
MRLLIGGMSDVSHIVTTFSLFAISRSYKFYSLAAIHYALKNFQTAKPSLRALDSSLTLGALLIHQLNALLHRPAEGQAESDLLEQSCMHEVDDSSDGDDSDQDYDPTTVPVLYNRGRYFASDIITDDRVMRLPVTRPIAPVHLAFFYAAQSIEALRQEFNLPQVMLPKTKGNNNRVNNRVTHTMAVEHLRDDDVHIPPLDLGLADRGVTIHPKVLASGRDVDEHEEFRANSSDDDNVEGNIDDIVDKIWSQFPYDIFKKAPNRKASSASSYLIATTHETENFTMDVFKSFDLSHIFSHIQAKNVNSEFWNETLFSRYFPDKSHKAKERGKLQNFPYLKYYQTWIDIINRMSKADVRIVRAALRRQFRELHWLPFAYTDRLWQTKVERGSNWVAYPKGNTGPAPHIAVNPRFARKGDITVQASNQASNSGDMDSE